MLGNKHRQNASNSFEILQKENPIPIPRKQIFLAPGLKHPEILSALCFHSQASTL